MTTSNSEPLHRRGARELAALVRARQVSSEELVRLFLSRIGTLDGGLGAFVSVHRRTALRAARAADAAVKRGEVLAPFHGVPTAVKDLNMVRGHVTRFGSRAVRLWSPVDCRTTASLRRGGFILLGKTATSEVGAMPVTETDAHPPCRNPWDPMVTPGGSSGGAASALAAGLLPIAHGSDGGGSIRIPSSLCGLYGLKPSRGRVPNAYGLPDDDILYTCGPLARSVEDAAAMLEVLSGSSAGTFTAALRSRPTGLRVRVTVDSPLVRTHPQVAEAVRRVARHLEERGHHVEEGPAPGGTVEEFLPVWQRQVANTPIFLPSRLQPVTRWLYDAGRALTDAQAADVQRRMTARVLEGLQGVDLWVTPTVAVPPPAIGAWRGLPPRDAFLRAAELGVFTAPLNLTGQPAASVPAGLLDGKWPMGVQLVGRPGDEATVLAASAWWEEAAPWRDRLPAGAA